MLNINISTQTKFLEQQSEISDNRFAFAYTITIKNGSDETIQLLSRHWVLTDGNEEIQEVHGEGVVGQKPHIPAGESFSYSSGAILKTSVGTMQGSYQFIDTNKQPFDIEIPTFRLAKMQDLH